MKRLWSTLACLGVTRVYITGAEKVEKAYFGSRTLEPSTFIKELIIGGRSAPCLSVNSVHPCVNCMRNMGLMYVRRQAQHVVQLSAVLCCSVRCHAVLCYAVWCCAMLSYATLRHATLLPHNSPLGFHFMLQQTRQCGGKALSHN